MSTPDKVTSEVDRLKTVIQGLLRQVPACVNGGSHQTAVAYKKLAQKAGKLAESPRTKLIDLQSAHSELLSYNNKSQFH